MRIQFLKNYRLPAILASLTLVISGLVGCASAPPELEEARSTYKEVSEGPAGELAPAQLAEAKKALELAEEAFEEEGDEPVTKTLSFRATRKAQIAAVEADIYQARRARDENQALYITKSEESRATLKDQLANQERQIQESAQAVQQQKDEIQKMEDNLAAARAKGEMTEAELKAQQEELQAKQAALSERETKLAVLRTELSSERERRKELQERLAAAMEKLDEFAKVDENADRMVITLSGEVLFEVGKSALMTSAKRKLDQVSEVLLAKRDAQITVFGHTDSQGDEKMNMDLSQDRADSVKDYLVSQEIASDRIDSVGKGESEPIASNDTPEGRANNRRVEIVVENQKASASR